MSGRDVPYLDADSLRGAVSPADLIDAVEAAYRDVAEDRDRSPQRTRVALAGGDLLLMPGVREGGQRSTVKLVTVMPDNAARGLPTVQAIVVLFDARTGQPRALLDGEMLTAMRTGAASGVATRLMAAPAAAVLGLIGAGGQAEWQVRCVAAARPIRTVLVYSRTPAARQAFAERMAAATGLEVRGVATAEAAVREADVVCCATTSSAPVFEAAWLRAGAHVNGIGAFRLEMVELPPELFGLAALVAVDDRRAALAEAGDVVAALRAGLVAEADLVPIGSVPAAYAAGRPAGAVTAFKSVGLAIQDLAAAEAVVDRLLA